MSNPRLGAIIKRWEVLLKRAVDENDIENKKALMNQLYGMMITLACLNETKLAEKVLKIYEDAGK